VAVNSKPLKTQNNSWILGVVVADFIVFVTLMYPAALDHATINNGVVIRLTSAIVAPVVVLLLTSLISPQIKATLVFWRAHHALPGHRAFTYYAHRDARIDMSSLRKAVGKFPTTPRDQNTTWYRLYREAENDSSVSLANRTYLLFRDIAALSILLAVVGPILVFIVVESALSAAMTAAMFAIQYLLSATAARHHGIALVTNVLALHAAKKGKK
jgi:hypothetical protein